MVQFGKLTNFQNFTIWKIHILQVEKLSNTWSVQIILIKYKGINSEIKNSNHSSLVILIFAILKFRNIDLSAFGRFKF